MPRSIFERKFTLTVKRVNKRVKDYIADPGNEDTIHDVRVAIRRLDVMHSLLPKKMRKQHRNQIDKYKQFLDANSEARDCDIIAARLISLGVSDTSDLSDKKKTMTARAVTLAHSLEKFPSLDGKLDDGRSDKKARRLVDKIKDILPLVLSDGNKVEELHTVRRDLRKLRYVLEVVPPNNRKKYMKKMQKAIDTDTQLEKLQDLLGSIHDCDITIEYLRHRPNEARLLEKEVGNRKRLFRKFVGHMTR